MIFCVFVFNCIIMYVGKACHIYQNTYICQVFFDNKISGLLVNFNLNYVIIATFSCLTGVRKCKNLL